ncbi:dienelactone hydrolase [Dipodascopsis uninucleata]
MASYGLSECCLTGFKYDGEAVGKIETFDDMEIYVTESPTNTTSAILYLTDIFGFPFTNHQLIADNFAKAGFLCIVPNLFGDSPAPYPSGPSFDLQAFEKKHNIETVEALIAKAFAYIKSTRPEIADIFAVGYCFGGKYVVRLLGQEKITAGFIAHPSLTTEEEVRSIKAPLSIAAAETDHLFPPEKRRVTEEILQNIKATYVLTLYSSVQHGFAVRGNLLNAEVKWAQDAAQWQAISWFKRFETK